jgi:hypothetical protein
MPLVKRIPVAVEIDCRTLTNRVMTSFTLVGNSDDSRGLADAPRTGAANDDGQLEHGSLSFQERWTQAARASDWGVAAGQRALEVPPAGQPLIVVLGVAGQKRCLRLLLQVVCRAFSRAWANTGNSSAI